MAHTFSCPEGHTFESNSTFRAHCPTHPDKLAKRVPEVSGAAAVVTAPTPQPTSTEPTKASEPGTIARRVVRVGDPNRSNTAKNKEKLPRMPVIRKTQSSSASNSSKTGTQSEDSQRKFPRSSAKRTTASSPSSAIRQQRASKKSIPQVIRKHTTENAGAGSQNKESRKSLFDSYINLGFPGRKKP